MAVAAHGWGGGGGGVTSEPKPDSHRLMKPTFLSCSAVIKDCVTCSKHGGGALRTPACVERRIRPKSKPSSPHPAEADGRLLLARRLRNQVCQPEAPAADAVLKRFRSSARGRDPSDTPSPTRTSGRQRSGSSAAVAQPKPPPPLTS